MPATKNFLARTGAQKAAEAPFVYGLNAIDAERTDPDSDGDMEAMAERAEAEARLRAALLQTRYRGFNS